MFAVVVVLDLLGVGLADGRHIVGVDDPRLHKVDRIEELEVTVVEILPVQSEDIRHDILREDPLILQVVDGEDRLDPRIAFIRLMLELQEHGNERGVPVVRVDDVRTEIQSRQEVEHSAAEEREPLGIVRIPVESLAVEILLVVHEVVGHAVQHILVNTDELIPPRNVQNPVVDVLHGVPNLLGNRTILRQDNTAIHSVLDECRRK